jgi:amidase
MARHTFDPTHFHLTIGEHEPVLHVRPGDTIQTWCVDAGGFDALDRKLTEGGNPQTGPFFVDGAEPGDVLAVSLDRLRPNRQRGFSGPIVAAPVVDPWFVSHLPERGEGGDVWTLDLEQGTATLDSPPLGLEHLGGRRDRADARVLRRRARRRPGDLLRDLGQARRQHGLPRLP